MMVSSANFVAYDLRPTKQIERRAIVEILAHARQAGFNIPKYRYIGMGGTKFVDFLLMERFVGFSEYISIEHDEKIFYRCKFNRPYNNIRMFLGEFSNFLITDTTEYNTTYWIDYDGAISPETFSDIKSIAGHVRQDDFVFLTIGGEFPSGTRNKSESDRKKIISDRFPSFRLQISKLPNNQFSDKRFRSTVGELLVLMFASAFSIRSKEGKFQTVLKVIYSDSTWMCTLGGVFVGKGSRKASKLRSILKERLSNFAPNKKGVFFEIPKINMTEFERMLFDKSRLNQTESYARRLLRLGFSDTEISQYHELSRFMPRYVEAAL
jgi:hypothetical protein